MRRSTCSLIFKTQVESRPSCADILEYLMKNNLPISPDTDILLNLVKDLQISVERLERLFREGWRDQAIEGTIARQWDKCLIGYLRC